MPTGRPLQDGEDVTAASVYWHTAWRRWVVFVILVAFALFEALR